MSTIPLADETSAEFRLLVAEIAETEGLAWPVAVERARAQWPEMEQLDPEAPIPYRPTPGHWPFVAWLFFLAFTISLSVNIGFVWVLVVYGGAQ